MNIKNLTSACLLGILILSGGCKKDFLVEHPKDIIAPDNLYVNKAGFDAGLLGLYYQVRSERKGLSPSSPSNDITNTAAIIGVDNAYSLYPAGGAAESVFNDFGVRLTSTNSYLDNFFTYLYKTINAANTIVERAETLQLYGLPPRKMVFLQRLVSLGPGLTVILLIYGVMYRSTSKKVLVLIFVRTGKGHPLQMYVHKWKKIFYLQLIIFRMFLPMAV